MNLLVNIMTTTIIIKAKIAMPTRTQNTTEGLHFTDFSTALYNNGHLIGLIVPEGQ